MHRRHLLGDIFLDLDSASDGPTGRTLQNAMRMVSREGRGVIVYLRPEGVREGMLTGSGELEQRLQTIDRSGLAGAREDGESVVQSDGPQPAHQRDFGVGGQILRGLGLSKLRLISNHQRELPGLEGFGLEIVERLGLANLGQNV